jgi:hypothetical protein
LEIGDNVDEKLEKYFKKSIKEIDIRLKGGMIGPAKNILHQIFLTGKAAGCHAQAAADLAAVKKLKLYPMLFRGEKYKFITIGEVTYALEAAEIKEE